MHSAQGEFEEAGLQIILVGMGRPEQSEEFRKRFAPSLTLICDPDKSLYQAFNLGRGSLYGMASPSVLIRGLRAMSRGNVPGMPQGDVMQMPGVFMIDTDGTIRYSYYAKDASDHPSVEELLGLKALLN
ncbi:MAG: redoxin domain-containing protein [Nitrospiraceae bacterium]|nr:MAG: redoxin domain-containing protein [Nitrospiraceae bacterium]